MLSSFEHHEEGGEGGDGHLHSEPCSLTALVYHLLSCN